MTPSVLTTDADRRPGPESRIGVLAVVVGFLVTTTGLFALPLNANPDVGLDFGFVEVRSFVALAITRTDNAFDPFSTLAAFWWRFGALIVTVVLSVLMLVVIATDDRRPFGWVIAVVAAAGGVLHGFALAQSTDLRNRAQLIVGYAQTNFYDHPGIGVWVSFAGFGLLTAAGVALALIGRTREPDEASVDSDPDVSPAPA